MRILYDGIPAAAIAERGEPITAWVRDRQPFGLRIALDGAARRAPFVFVDLKKTELISRYGQESYWLVEPLTMGDSNTLRGWAAEHERRSRMGETTP